MFFRENLKRIPQIRANTTTFAAAAPTSRMDSPPKGRTDCKPLLGGARAGVGCHHH
jgi:hypothetical protein